MKKSKVSSGKIYQSSAFKNVAKEIADTGRFLANQGWSPATSSNYSARIRMGKQSHSESFIALTRSGIDKFQISADDVLLANLKGEVLFPIGERPSAETLIHCFLYQNPEVNAVLHTHSVLGTRLSLRFEKQKEISFSGYEILKGFAGISTHETQLYVPVLPNDQNMPRFVEELKLRWPTFKAPVTGFLMAGHGLYTWGATMKECRRHIETFEYLFECLASELSGV